VSDATVRALADRAAIQDVLARYARGVDRKDATMVASCFAPGCAYEGALGRGTIEDVLPALARAMERYAKTLHVLGTQAIELDGDAARVETYCLAHHEVREAAPGRTHRTVAVRYEDAFRRVDGRWLITARTVRAEWERWE
jgi:hypothetical protein